MTESLRNHGFGGDVPEVTGVPVASTSLDASTSAVHESGQPCPNCSCKELMQIVIPVRHERLTGRRGTGFYVGCPACPWASPMIMVADLSSGGEGS
jgi:hypothetical protein|tara:strand:+ start:160 stop:447 length:288 start_codon:yes stop_codon:yes gene_type:complete